MASPMDVLGGLKSKLGLGARKSDDYDEYDEYDEYDDYDEYADDGYDSYDDYRSDRYSSRSRGARDSGYDRERDRYSSRDVVTTRGASSASLVSYDDVRYNSRSSSYTSPRTSAARTMVDSSLPPSLTPEGYAAASAAASRKRDGLDSLFSSTAGDSQPTSGGLGIIGAAAGEGASGGAHARGSLDPAFGDGASGFKANRQVVVLRPTDYNDVESVAGTLKNGDAVILSLKLTPDGLSKRILDFSFGVASALDASVDCISDKVFAITRGAGLTETELSTLRSQGVVA